VTAQDAQYQRVLDSGMCAVIDRAYNCTNRLLSLPLCKAPYFPYRGTRGLTTITLIRFLMLVGRR